MAERAFWVIKICWRKYVIAWWRERYFISSKFETLILDGERDTTVEALTWGLFAQSNKKITLMNRAYFLHIGGLNMLMKVYGILVSKEWGELGIEKRLHIYLENICSRTICCNAAHSSPHQHQVVKLGGLEMCMKAVLRWQSWRHGRILGPLIYDTLSSALIALCRWGYSHLNGLSCMYIAIHIYCPIAAYSDFPHFSVFIEEGLDTRLTSTVLCLDLLCLTCYGEDNEFARLFPNSYKVSGYAIRIVCCVKLKLEWGTRSLYFGVTIRGGSRIIKRRGHVCEAHAKFFRPCPQIIDHAPKVAVCSDFAPASWLWLSHLWGKKHQISQICG